MSVLDEPYFHDEEAAFAKLESINWPNGPVCPHCGGLDRIYPLKSVRSKASKKNPQGLIRHGLKKCGHAIAGSNSRPRSAPYSRAVGHGGCGSGERRAHGGFDTHSLCRFKALPYTRQINSSVGRITQRTTRGRSRCPCNGDSTLLLSCGIALARKPNHVPRLQTLRRSRSAAASKPCHSLRNQNSQDPWVC